MRRAFVLVPAVALFSVFVAQRLATLPAVFTVLAVALIVAGAMWAAEARRVRRLASDVNAWLGRRHPGQVDLSGGAHWGELEVAVNAAAAAYDRRGDKLRRERPWRRDLVDSLVGPALLFAADGRLVAANDDARQRLGIAAHEPRPSLVQALGSARLAAAAREALASGKRTQIDATVQGRELRAVCSVVGDEVLVVITDLTHHRRTEEVRRDFVVNASHELKTPATGIQSLIDALDVVAEKDPSRVPAVAERLRSESERLVRIVHDLLDLSRLESHSELERTTIDLSSLVRAVVADVDRRATERDITVEAELPEHANVAGIAGDLRLIVDNLVRNAVQYNRPGGEVFVLVRPADGGYELIVSDTGLGIPQADLPRIFERFYRVDEDRSRERGGTGLGLSIVKHAVDRQGGSIRVDSLLGEGTTFTVHLPIDPPRR